MSDTAPVVWLEEGETRADAVRALDEWARARGVRLVAPAAGARTTPDPDIAERVERELDHASVAIGAADAESADRALGAADELLRAHPELPQAAWLRAEVHRAWAARFLRLEPRDDARARAAWDSAEALDHGRVAGVGETAFARPAHVPTTLIISGGGDLVSLRFDGQALEPVARDAQGAVFRVDAAPAEHQVVVLSGTTVLFATWLATGTDPVRVALGDAVTCRRDAFAEVHRDGDAIAATGVGCPSWIAARAGEKPGSVWVARCEASTCGPLIEWRVEQWQRADANENKAALKPRSRWPAWATWTLVGVGVVAAASVAVIASGALESRPVVPRFVVGGARQE